MMLLFGFTTSKAIWTTKSHELGDNLLYLPLGSEQKLQQNFCPHFQIVISGETVDGISFLTTNYPSSLHCNFLTYSIMQTTFLNSKTRAKIGIW